MDDSSQPQGAEILETPVDDGAFWPDYLALFLLLAALLLLAWSTLGAAVLGWPG